MDDRKNGGELAMRQDDIYQRLNMLEDLIRENLGKKESSSPLQTASNLSQSKRTKKKVRVAESNNAPNRSFEKLARSSSAGQNKRTQPSLGMNTKDSKLTRNTITRHDPKLESEYASKVRESNFVLAKELTSKHGENEHLRNTIVDREKQLGSATNGLDRLGMREDRLLEEIELLKRENKLLEDKTFELRTALQNNMSDRYSESYLLLENENLKEDVLRLIKMLQRTSEYKNFADYADASGSIHYLKSVGKFSKLDLAERFHDLKNVPHCKNSDLFVDEKMLWVPQEAYKFAHEFRIKYDGKLTESLIEHLLFNLNQVWNQREKRLLSNLKSSYNSETEFLRRKIANTPSLELNHMAAEIQRLKKDLKNAYRDNREFHANRGEMNPQGMQYIKGALKMANDYNTNKRKLEKQNKYYKEVTEAYQKVLNEDYKGNIYLTEDGKDSQNAIGLKHEVSHLIQEYEAKAGKASGYSKADIDKLDQLRDHYMTLIRRKLDTFCVRLDRDFKGADTAFHKTKDRLYHKK